MILYPGRKACGLKRDDLVKANGRKEYASVAIAVKPSDEHLMRNKREQPCSDRLPIC